jgi:hypothetical protein
MMKLVKQQIISELNNHYYTIRTETNNNEGERITTTNNNELNK